MYLLYAANRQKEATLVVLVSTVINIALNFILIPKYSYLGAAWTTVVAEIINVCLFFCLVSKLLNFNYKDGKSVIKSLAGSIILGILIYNISSLVLPVIISISTVSYIVMVFLMRYFDAEEIEILKEIIRKKT
jgi:O-antigen/teichoic acid export membrane protein